MSSWSQFRKVWLLPEVYPLIGAVSIAVGAGVLTIANKIRLDPFCMTNRRRRSDFVGTVESVEHAPIFGERMKTGTTRMFGLSENEMLRINAKHPGGPITAVIRAPEEDVQKDEEQNVVEDSQKGSEISASTSEENNPLEGLEVKAQSRKEAKMVIDKALDALSGSIGNVEAEH